VEVFEAFALGDEFLGATVIGGGVDAGYGFAGGGCGPVWLDIKSPFQDQFGMGACSGIGFLGVSG